MMSCLLGVEYDSVYIYRKISQYETASEYKKQKVGVWELIISKTEKGQKWLDGE